MLRIYFTNEDVARTRLAPSFDPLWELVLSLHMLRGQRGDMLFADWRRSTATAVRHNDLVVRMRVLADLIPTFGYFPDFLNPTVAVHGLEHGLEAVRSTPGGVLRRDLERLSSVSATTTLTGPDSPLGTLTDTMRAYYDVAISPYRQRVEAAVERDRVLRMRTMASFGVEGLLASMQPSITWSAGELRVEGHADQEIRLDGRGLSLIPSYFCIRHPVTLFDGSLPPVLVYPIERTHETLPPRDTQRSLGALIGHTRAAILAAANGVTTTDLARRVGVSAGTASEHAAVLREAGLIVSHRDRSRMVHQLTRLGLALLNGG